MCVGVSGFVEHEERKKKASQLKTFAFRLSRERITEMGRLRLRPVEIVSHSLSLTYLLEFHLILDGWSILDSSCEGQECAWNPPVTKRRLNPTVR